MARLVEDPELRNKVKVFADRTDAGRALADLVAPYISRDTVVLAIPSGGVPVGVTIANELRLDLGLVLVRKLAFPEQPEAGFGAITLDGTTVLNEDLVQWSGLTEEEIQEVKERTMRGLRERADLFGTSIKVPAGKDVLLVDDGLASGFTMLAAVRSLMSQSPGSVSVAVPTASRDAAQRVMDEVGTVFCANVRAGTSFAVAEAYRHWYDLTEEEALSLLPRRILE